MAAAAVKPAQPQVSKSIFILPKPQPGQSSLPGGSILMEGTTVLDSARRLALSGSSPAPAANTPAPSNAVTPSPNVKFTIGADSPNSNSSSGKCKRKLNFAKLGLPANGKHCGSPRSVEKRNARERNRVKTINETFIDLRDHLPCGNGVMQRKKQKKMSKVDILKGAIDYITMMQEIINETDSLNGGMPASPMAPSTPGTPSTTSNNNIYSSPDSPQQVHPASMQAGGYTTTNYPSSPAANMYPSTPSHNRYSSSSANQYSQYPTTPYSHTNPQAFDYPSGSITQGNFLDALAEAEAVNQTDLLSSAPLMIQTQSQTPMRSPGSVCSNSDSVSTASPAQSVTPVWAPDEEDIQQLAAWFQ